MLRRQNHQNALDYAEARISEYKEKLIDVEDMIEEILKGSTPWMVGERPMYDMLRAIERQLCRYLIGKVQQVRFVESKNKASDENEAWFNYRSNPDNDKAIQLCGMPVKVLR